MVRSSGRWLAGIGVVLAVIAVALYVFRDQVMNFTLDPSQPFAAVPAPPNPDYGSDDAWAALPGRMDGSDLAPRNAPSAPVELHEQVDVFFIHPTTFASSKGWNAPINGEAAQTVKTVILPNQASAFAAAGRVFAPHYRQATLYSFRTRGDDARRARTLAYRDVRRAFRNYLRFRAGRRPFILAGEGQGALHALGLLQDEIAGTRVQDRLIAAYLIGHPVPLDLFADALYQIEPCRNASQTGCVVAWSAYPQNADAVALTERSLVWESGRLNTVGERPILCINPLSWAMDEIPALAARHLGALPLGRYMGADLPALTPLATGAQCVGGILRLDRTVTELEDETLYAGRPHHQLGINAVYANIRINAVERANTYLTGR